MNTKKIVIYDRNTHGVFCETESIFLARSLIAGMENGEMAVVSGSWAGYTVLLHDKEFSLDYNFNDPAVHVQLIGKDTTVRPMPAHMVTDEWKEKRAKVIVKIHWLEYLEFLTKCLTMKTTEYYGMGDFEGFLNTQLSKCDPANNYYTPAVVEWAGIQDVPVSAAFQELTIRSENHGMAHVRNHAIYMKYLRKMNQANTEAEYKDLCDQAWTDLIRNALV